MVALFILRLQFAKAEEEVKEQIILFYLKYLEGVNNRNLVDGSAHYLKGRVSPVLIFIDLY